jgi:transposase
MATTSFLYHAPGLRGHRHLATRYEDGAVYHHVALPFEQRRCRGCGARCHDLTLEGRFERVFRALPVGSRRQYVVLHGHEQRCRRCGELAREPIPFSDGKRRHLRAFERYMVDLFKIAPIKHVARVVCIGWTAVKEAFKRHLQRRLKQGSLGGFG